MGIANISGNILTDSGTNLSTLVSGSGTSGYLSKFTGASSLGNSMVSDDGTTLTSAGATRSNLYLKAASTSYYSQLAFTNGSSALFGGLSYNNAGQYMQFETNSSEWMRLTSNGYLGIGTTGPSDVLDVQKNSNATTNFYFRNLDVTNTNSRAYLNVIAGNVTTSLQAINNDHSYLNCTNNLYLQTGGGTRMTITSSGNVGIGTSSPGYLMTLYASSLPQLAFQNSGAVRAIIGADSGSLGFNSLTGSPIIFSIDSTERMRITSGGNVGIGTSAPSGKLEIQAGVSTDSAPHILLGGNGYSGFHWINNTAYYIGQNSQSRDLRVYSGNNTAVGVVLNPNATSWTNYSDERLKTNIENFGSVLENVLSLRTIKYHFKDVDKQDSQKRYGLVAQDLVGKFDEVLSKSKFSEDDETEYFGVRYTELIPVLVAAIQELSDKVTALENK